MTIEYRHANDGSGSMDVVTTACPYCGADIGEQESLAKHLRHTCEAKP